MARPQEAVGRLWRLQGGRHRAGQKVTGRGPWVQTSPSFRFSWLGSGLGTLESFEERPRSMATVLERASTVQLQ
jgi:hypothetical protein